MLNPLVLAYVGDAVHALWLKSRLALGSDAKAGELNRVSGRLLSAREQSLLADRLQDVFIEGEKDIFRRARNCHSNTPAKNASLEEYRKATGFEAVLGYLFLAGDSARMSLILESAYEKEKDEII